MTRTLVYFYRHPHEIYFSLEKLFKAISTRIGERHADKITVQEIFLPFPSNAKTLFRNISFAKRGQGDINHITGDIHYAILGFSNRRINILTIHDCVLLRHAVRKNLKYRLLKWLWYDLPVKKAKVVTVISENTKKELLGYTRCDPGKIRVIPNFVDPVFRPLPFRFNKEKPRILFLGSTPNKNLFRLAEAIKGLELSLEIVGRLNRDQTDVLERNGIDFTVSSGLTQEALVDKYRNCDILAFPSTYEGFGLPIIEAQAVGRPVLTSKLAPMDEVSGNGACLVDPFDIISIRSGIERIITDDVYRTKIIEDGFDNVKRFTLERVADLYYSLYTDLLKKN